MVFAVRCCVFWTYSSHEAMGDGMRTLFLDFDEVLHPKFCRESKHFTFLPNFEQVLRRVRNPGTIEHSIHFDLNTQSGSTWRS